METKMITDPFTECVAREISYQSRYGVIMTSDGRRVRIISWNMKQKKYPIVALVYDESTRTEECLFYTNKGICSNGDANSNLLIQHPDLEQFKEGDVVMCGNNVVLIKHIGEGIDKSLYIHCGIEKGELVYPSEQSCYANKKFIKGYASDETRQELIELLKEDLCPENIKLLNRFFLKDGDYYYIMYNSKYCMGDDKYTEDRAFARLYNREEVEDYLSGHDDVVLVPMTVREHNFFIDYRIKELSMGLKKDNWQ